MIITDDIEEIAIMKHRFDSFEHEMNATASKVAVVNQLARQLLQIEHPGAAEVISRQNQLNGRSVKRKEKSDWCPEFFHDACHTDKQWLYFLLWYGMSLESQCLL